MSLWWRRSVGSDRGGFTGTAGVVIGVRSGAVGAGRIVRDVMSVMFGVGELGGCGGLVVGEATALGVYGAPSA